MFLTTTNVSQNAYYRDTRRHGACFMDKYIYMPGGGGSLRELFENRELGRTSRGLERVHIYSQL